MRGRKKKLYNGGVDLISNEGRLVVFLFLGDSGLRSSFPDTQCEFATVNPGGCMRLEGRSTYQIFESRSKSCLVIVATVLTPLRDSDCEHSRVAAHFRPPSEC